MRKKFACDFETTTDPKDCRVWAYGIRQIYKESFLKIGNNLEEFMDWCININSDLYFHNLKFDGSFIVNWLLKNGYRYSENGEPNTFKTVISSMGQWYMIDIVNEYVGNRKKHTVIYDSLKKLPFKIKEIAESFKLPILKGEIDYNKYRPVDHEITKEELDYIINDVEILARALEIQFDNGQTKITNGSDALSEFKDIVGKKSFQNMFPTFNLELDKNLRPAYKGGFTWLNEKYQDKEIHGGIVLDVNSMYPGVMMNRDLPVGYPIFFNGQYEYDSEYPLYIQHIRCEFDLKDGFIPTIQIKKNLNFKANEYLKSSDGEVVDLYVTNVDLELIKKHYYLHDLQYMSGFKFKKMPNIFNDYINKWMNVKTTSKGAIKLLAKLMLNSLYGKFATNPDVTGKVPYLKDDGSNGFSMGDEEYRDPVYTPMGIFITSWARHECISTAQSCFDRIIYCDTDSIHLTGSEIPDSIKDKVDPDLLGYWDFEGEFKRGKYLRQKTYIHEYDNNGETKTVVKCAGMPDNIKEKVTFDTFQIGFTSPGKLLPQQVSGGVVLKDVDFTIK